MAVSKAKREQRLNLNLESIVWNDLTWVNIKCPTKLETEYLAYHFPFHPLNLDDVLSRIQRPKIDEYSDHLFIVLHFPVYSKDDQAIISGEVDIFIGENYLVTIDCSGGLKPLDKLFNLCQIEEEARQENFSQGSGFLLYRITDRLVDYCLPILNKIIENIENVEDEIFSEGRKGTIKKISMLRRDIISFRRIIWPMRAVFSSLEPKVRRFTKMDMAVYFGDMVDHVDKIWDGLDECKEIIEGLNYTYDSLTTNRTNEVMRMLTIIGTVLLPLIVVSSIYGMNVPLPFQGSHYALLLVLLITLVIIGAMLYFFRRQRWI